MRDTKKRSISNGTGSIVPYEKTIYVPGKGENAGHKVKKTVDRYRVRYRFKNEFGEQQQASKSDFTSLTEAKKYLNDLTQDISNGEYIHKKDITISEFADGWFSDYCASDYRPNTMDWHKYNIENIKRGLGEIQLQHLVVRDIKGFYTKLLNEDNLSSTYISNINRTLKQILDEAANSDVRCIKKNPCRDKDVRELVKRIKRNHKSKCKAVVISQKDLVRLIEYLKDQPGAIAIALSGLVGLRIGEVRGLQWNDIDFDKKTLNVRHQLTRHCGKEFELTELKTEASYKILKLNSYMIELLRREQQRQKRLEKLYGKEKFSLGFVCVHTNNQKLMGNPFAHNYYNTLLNKGLCELGLNRMRWHDLRHSFGSNLLYQNIPIHTVSKLMRHSSVAITAEIYDETNDNADNELFDKVIEVNLNKSVAEINDTNSVNIARREPINRKGYSSPRLKRNIYIDPKYCYK